MADANNRQPKKIGLQKLSNPVVLGLCLASMCFAAAYISCQPVKKESTATPLSSSATALTTEQMNSFNEVINGISRIESAAIELKGLGTVPPVTDKVEQDLRDAMTTAACAVVYSRAQALTGPRESTLTISGASCPITAGYASKYLPATTNGQYSLLAAFKISDATFKTRNDVHEIALTGTGNHSVTTDRTTSNTEVSGNIHTTTKGLIKISINTRQTTTTSLNGTSVEGTRSIKLSFPELSVQKPAYQAELKVDFSVKENEDQSRYQINNLEISKSEYDIYIQKLGIIAL
ncbi:MAG: hypothetical protein ACXWC9_09510 [Pseudobdellovibrionaceae bacterium]